jgi:SpoVT / AbrB like domain.
MEIIRKIETGGRVSIPIDVRKQLDLEIGDELDFIVSDTCLTIRKRRNSCTFCRSEKKLIEYKGKFICEDCYKLLQVSEK